jgi:hypothetical protein
MLKIDSCIHRSAEKIAGKVKVCNCGATKDIEEYQCNSRGIFPLNSQICDACNVFEVKSSIEEEIP